MRALNGRVVAGRTIVAALWDGKTRYKRVESDAERRRRENAWSEFLVAEEETGADEAEAGTGETKESAREETSAPPASSTPSKPSSPPPNGDEENSTTTTQEGGEAK